ncbi:hypothetical protein [Salipiger abyssi]|uniref:hypothetical protein n=1 Tax=Salipiger abyssi TaxID=1250539 RepID=UPI0018DEC62E|nr:hypothetical protein [Salipiger abyssi]
MSGKIARFLRVFIPLPAAGILAALGVIDLDKATEVLAIDSKTPPPCRWRR